MATRKSQLALAQSRAFATRLCEAHSGLSVAELLVVTTGDRIQDRPLAEVGGKGVFVKEIEEALIERRADFAVHSIKDVPGLLADGLRIGCVPLRADPRDVLVSRTGAGFAQLPAGASVGTSSLRRSVLLHKARPDLTFVPLRGNVDTRLRKVREGVVDAAILAKAGLDRLGLADAISEILAPELCIPAVGQGALGIECREGDDRVLMLLAALHHEETALAVAAERGVMIEVEGNCRTPIAAHARRAEDGTMLLVAMLAEPDGSNLRFVEQAAPWPTTEQQAGLLGRSVGSKLRR
ncbi:MAG: hydroxymethylbilane synthase [Deltaproteobacteria bacterium]|nr:hydroxymethylbilane synthase [Deltaproteobacteria bacterium]